MSEQESPIHEYIPNPEIIREFFDSLTNGKAYVETKKLEDAKGIYQWDIEVDAGDGGKYEYSYVREGNYPGTAGRIVETAIHKT